MACSCDAATTNSTIVEDPKSCKYQSIKKFKPRCYEKLYFEVSVRVFRAAARFPISQFKVHQELFLNVYKD